MQNDAGETGSVGSQETVISTSELSTPSKRPLQKGLRYVQHGSVLRHVILKMASAQLVSAADRVDAGMPTAVAAAAVVVVGTSHGIVLVFDSRQTLRWCLGGAGGVGAEFGAVSALAYVPSTNTNSDITVVYLFSKNVLLLHKYTVVQKKRANFGGL